MNMIITIIIILSILFGFGFTILYSIWIKCVENSRREEGEINGKCKGMCRPPSWCTVRTNNKNLKLLAMDKNQKQTEINKYEKFMHWLWRQKSITELVLKIGMDGIAQKYVKERVSANSSHDAPAEVIE